MFGVIQVKVAKSWCSNPSDNGPLEASETQALAKLLHELLKMSLMVYLGR
jgi:hypothetical protein